ncbi:MAG: 16S rRNA (adenine(1518)-N(6)/adenine(1519)-N(6))-dimethyltransferase RsmA [Thermoplasmata archaeon]
MGDSVKDRLNRLGVRPTVSLGQNFLDDRDSAEKIVDAAEINDSDTVLEIGPGLGVLTDFIVKRAEKTILVEKDKALIGYLEGRYSGYETTIIEGDVLEINLPVFDKVISNLPFSISSPVTFKLLDEDFQFGVLTYQKQFAERMVADPRGKNYSRLSVMVSVRADVERLFNLSKGCFYPPPKVDATVVRLTPSEPEFELIDKDIFAEVVKHLFNYRRKQIKNALELGLEIVDQNIPYRKRRVGNLSPEQINEIVTHIIENDLMPEDRSEKG